jgi:tetratricopeptide (TPR) repeat protein
MFRLKILKFQLIFGCSVFLCGGALFTEAHAQETAPSAVATNHELSRRVEAAVEARNSGDPNAIAAASKNVIALALAGVAKIRLDQKSYDEAIRLSLHSLEFEDTAETRIEVAIADLLAKKTDEAVKQASSAVEIDPQNVLAWTIKGEALLRNEEYAEAATALGKALEIKRDSEALYALGIADLGLGKKQEAAEIFSQFLALIGESGWSHLLVGRAYQEQVLLADAQKEFQNALRIDPATPNANYFWAISAMQANGGNPNDEVYSHLQAELRLNPRHFEANYMLGFLASTTGNDLESDRFLHLASKIKPAEPEAWVFLGLNAQKRKSNQAAEMFFRKAIELTKNLDLNEHFEIRRAYFGLGRILMSSGRTKEGEAILSKARELQAQNLGKMRKKYAAIESGSEDPTARSAAPYIPGTQSGQRVSVNSEATATAATPAKMHQNHPASTARELETEKYLRAVLGASFNDLATAEALQQKYQEGFEHYQEAARWDPKIPGLDRNLGLAAYFVKNYAEAVRLLSKAIAAEPKDKQARAILGLTYFATKNFVKTVQTLAPMAEHALQDQQLGSAFAQSLKEIGNKTEAARAYHQLGLGLIKSGNLSDGIDYLEEAERLQPTQASIHADLEVAYRKAGRGEDADREKTLFEAHKTRQKKAEVIEIQKEPR